MEKLMNLTPREKDKLMIAVAALVARTVGVMPYAI
jgi:urease gamma subunit